MSDRIDFKAPGADSVDVILSSNNKQAIVFSLQGESDAGAQSTIALHEDEGTNEVQYWGGGNDNPKKWREKVSKSTTVLPLLFKSVQLLYGKGIYYYTEEINEKGELIEKRVSDPDIDAFLSNSRIEFYLLKALMDYKFFNNVFTEFITNKDASKIVLINHLQAEFSRFSKPDDKGKILKLFYESTWPDKKTNTEIDYLDYSDIQFQKNGKLPKKKFASHACFPVPGYTLYSIPSHFALLQDKSWLDFTNSIPLIMNSVNDNVLDVRFHVKIPYSYWPLSVVGWEAMSADDKKKTIDEKLSEMRDFLTGTKNAGKTFFSHFGANELSGETIPGWSIEEIKSSDKKDKYLTSVQEGDIQSARALNVDVSLANIQPAGGKMGAGSGSDKRTAFTNSVSLSPAEAEIILEPLRTVQRINGWDPKIKWGFQYEIPVPLNESKTGTTDLNP